MSELENGNLEDFGVVEEVWEASSGKGRNIKVNSIRYFSPKDNINVPEIKTGDMVKFEYTKSGKDGSLLLLHRMSIMSSEDIDKMHPDAPKADDKCQIGVGKPPHKEQKSLINFGSGVVEPIAGIDDIKKSWDQFNMIKKAVVEAGDIQTIRRKRDGVEKEEAYIKKSGWRKVQVAYGLRTEIINKERVEANGTVFYNFIIRATARGGQYAEAIGSCNTGERQFAHGESDVMMTAQTRATNRAISDLVGGGDVSAEEME